MRCYVALCSLLLLGVVEGGFPGGLEYQFRYSIRGATGIPSIDDQYAAVGIHADVTMQVTDIGNIIVQITNGEIGYYNDKFHNCDPSAPLPIEYHPMDMEGISQPFSLHLNGTSPGYMDGPSQPTWITNIKKGLANIIKIPPLQGYLNYENIFYMTEDTINGECKTGYTLLKLTDYQNIMENKRQEQTIEEDAQFHGEPAGYTTSKTGSKTRPASKTSSKTSSKTHSKTSKTSSKTHGRPLDHPVPEISRDLWKLTRALNHSDCHGGVHMRVHGNKIATDSIEQSTTSTYLLRGEVGSFRLERAVVIGTVTVFPDPHDHQHFIRAVTNQTLELVAVRPLTNEHLIDFDPAVRHTNFHFTLDYMLGLDPNRRPSMTEALTGHPMSQQTLIDSQALVVEYLTQLSSSLLDDIAPDQQTTIDLFKTIHDILQDFTLEEIETVESKIPSVNGDVLKEILLLMVSGTGTKAAVDYTIMRLSNPETYNELFYIHFIMESLVTIKNPAIVKSIVDFVQVPLPTLDERPEIRRAMMVLVAQLIHDQCLDPHKEESTSFTECETHYTCKPEEVLEPFMAPLVMDIQNAEQPNYIRRVSLQAICNLGTPIAINILQDVVLGKYRVPTNMKLQALYCLDAHHMPYSARITILKILIPIIDNIGEIPEVRSLAFLTATTWTPSLMWWHAKALSTWHEPSTQVATFITSTLTALARGTGPLSELAGRSVHLAKPSAPVSLPHSTHLFLRELLRKCSEIGWKVDIAWLSTMEDSIPDHLLLKIIESPLEFGEEHKTWIQLFTHHVKNYMRRRPSKSRNQDDIVLVLDEFRGLMENLEVGQFTPLLYTYPATFFLDGLFNDAMLAFLRKIPMANLYWDSKPNGLFATKERETIYTFITEFGVPITVKYVKESVSNYDSKREDTFGSSSTKVAMHSSERTNIELEILLPLEGGFSVASGITNTLITGFQYKTTRERDPITGEKLYKFEPVDQNEKVILQSINLPYTKLSGLYPAQQVPTEWVTKPIILYDISREGDILPQATGVSLYYTWHGDIPMPKGPMDLFKTVGWTIPNFHYWNYRLSLRPQHSTTSTIGISFILQHRSVSERQVSIVEVDSTGQVQGGGDYEGQVQGGAEYDFTGQVSGGGFQFEQDAGFDQTFGHEQIPSHFDRIQQEVQPTHGGWVGTWGFYLDFLAPNDRGPRYETAVTWSRSKDHKTTRLILSLTTFPPEGDMGEPTAVCFDLNLQKPAFPVEHHPLQPEDLKTTANFAIHHGTSCNSGPPVMKVEGTLSITPEALAKVVEEYDHDCHHDPINNPTDLKIFTSQVYNDLTFHVTWTDELPPVILNLTRHLDDYLQLWLHPHISYDHVSTHHEHHVLVHATKSQTTNLWHVVTEKPEGVSLVEHLKAPFWFQALVIPGDLYNVFNHRYMYGEDLSQCVVTDTQVRTYDGREYTFTPSGCWNTLHIQYMKPEPENPNSHEVSVQVRYDEEWELKMLHPYLGLYIEATRTQLMLNGEPVERAPKSFTYKITENGITVDIHHTLHFEITDKIVLKVPNYFYGLMRGLCGVYDGDQINDFTGPQGCLYSDSELFVHSWTTSGQGCNRFDLRRNKAKVTEYQEDACPNEVYHSTGITHPNVSIGTSCTQWQYHEMNYAGLHCTTLSKYPVCTPECINAHTEDKLLEYKCKPSTPDEEDSGCRNLLIPTINMPDHCIPRV